jgi:hypothetical protein
MKEILRLSETFREAHSRFVVRQDDDGFFYIDDHQVVRSDYTGSVFKNTVRENIHGKMDAEAYAQWLSNIVFRLTYRNATKSEKEWMVDKPEEGKTNGKDQTTKAPGGVGETKARARRF